MGGHPVKPEIQISAPARLQKVAVKRLERFAVLFPKSLISDAPETFHDLRVASRRLQQVLRVTTPELKSTDGRKLSRLPRRTRRAFGLCRNLDVCLALVGNRLNAPCNASLRRAWEALHGWLEEKRRRELGHARDRLPRREFFGFIVRVRARLVGAPQDSGLSEELSRRVQSAFALWKDSLATARTEREAGPLHDLRIAGKRLRYRAEMLSASGEMSVKPLVRDLRALQDSLGEWHYRFILRREVAEFIGRPGFLAEEPGLCRALLLEMEREKQRDEAAADEIVTRGVEIAEREASLDPGTKPPESPVRDQ